MIPTIVFCYSTFDKINKNIIIALIEVLVMKKTLLVVMIAFAALSTYAQKCYVVKADGSQQKAIDIKVKNANGDLNVLVKQGQQPILFSRNMYRYAVVPKPPQVEQLGNALLVDKYDDVINASKQLYDAYKENSLPCGSFSVMGSRGAGLL